MEEELAEGLCGGCRHLPLERRIFGGAPFDHGETAARLVYALKYEHIIAAAEPLIPGMLNELPKGFDALVPVPLHVRRQRVRGYNQSMALCEALGRASGLPILNALRRTRATRQQMKLAADEREANVSRAFEVIKPVGGKRLIIVDDVRTTGWTILSCADELYLKGAINVRSLTATLAVIGR
jgi:ComF family protein